jgi:hypothetical protein
MADQFTEDRAIEDAAQLGEKRLENQRKFSAPLLLPDEDLFGDGREIFTNQARYLSNEEIRIYHLELYRRVQGFLDFFDSNVGLTEDYPLMVLGESEGAIEVLEERLAEMRSAVGLLTEL